MKCKYCGSEIPDTALFCTNCGAKIEDSPDASSLGNEATYSVGGKTYVNRADSGAAGPGGSDTNSSYADYSQSTFGEDISGGYQGSFGSEYQSTERENRVHEKLLALVKDGLFLAVCILLSVSALADMAQNSIPVIVILLAIFCWLIYASGRKGTVRVGGIRCISGTIFASCIINWVVGVILILCGLFFRGAVSLILNNIDIEMDLNDILQNIDITTPMAYSTSAPITGGYGNGMDGMLDLYGYNFESLARGALGTWVMVVLVVVGVAVIIINILGRRKIHRFVQSLYKCEQDGKDIIAYQHGAKVWLMVIGVVKAVSAVFLLFNSGLYGFISGGCYAAALIISSVLAGKYFEEYR